MSFKPRFDQFLPMQIIPPELFRKTERDRESLITFLEMCRDQARQDEHYKVASITLEVKHIDPLAVLESIFEPDELHFYLEYPVAEESVAGAEAIIEKSFAGPERFSKVREFAQSVLEHTIIVGEMDIPFGGPHFFIGFTFFDDVEGEDFFHPATIFLPRWQVSHREGIYGAVANILVEPQSKLEPMADKVLSAHAKFSAFDYEESVISKPSGLQARITEAGGQGSFEAAVRTGLEQIESGEYQKIVLARAVDIVSDLSFDPLSSLNLLRNKFRDCHAFSMANGLEQSFIGATPELSLRVRGKELFTEAIAGSAPRGKTAGDDARFARELLGSEKDLREHNIVVDSIQRRLRLLGIEPEISERPYLLQLSNVQHLRSLINAEIPGEIHILDILASLHPTPAVGGTPREAAIPDIRKIESFDRGLYAGAIGWFDYRGDGEIVVAIRSALIDGCRARIYAGNGIVSGSDPEREKLETDLKLQALLEALT